MSHAGNSRVQLNVKVLPHAASLINDDGDELLG